MTTKTDSQQYLTVIRKKIGLGNQLCVVFSKEDKLS